MLAETAMFAALRQVLTSFGLVSSTPGELVPVVRGQTNRVPPPALPDYVVMWPLRRDRLSTNIDAYADVVVSGSIAGNVLTATSVSGGSLGPGQSLFSVFLSGPCRVTTQLGGTTGGVGTYGVTPVADVAATSIYAGTGSLLQPVDFVVQLDVHGPASGDNAQIISTVMRDAVGVNLFAAITPGLVPLYADDPHQAPFIDAEAQFEERWVVDLHLQADLAVVVSQQFADQLQAWGASVDVFATPAQQGGGVVIDASGNPEIDAAGNPTYS